jgi:hypothetical protein
MMGHWDDVGKALASSGFYAAEERKRKRIDQMIDESEAYRQAQEAKAINERKSESP